MNTSAKAVFNAAVCRVAAQEDLCGQPREKFHFASGYIWTGATINRRGLSSVPWCLREQLETPGCAR